MTEPLQDEVQIAGEARHWVQVRKSSGRLSEADRASFDRWLVQSASHLHHYLVATASDKEASRGIRLQPVCTLSDLIEIICRSTLGGDECMNGPTITTADATDAVGRTEIGEVAQANGPTPAVQFAPLGDGPTGPRAGPARVVTSFSLLGFLALLPVLHWAVDQRASASGWKTYDTSVGRTQWYTLEDGTHMTLRPSSTVQVRFTNDLREVRLIRGTADFAPCRDSAKPFRVATVYGNIDDVGTEFTVSLTRNQASVSVTEGKVLLTATNSDSKTEARAGERARLTSHGHAELLSASGMPIAMSTANIRSLTFLEGTLAKIVTVFNARNHTPQFVVTGTARARVISGSMNVDDPASLSRLLRGYPYLTLTPRGDLVVIGETREEAAARPRNSGP
jgi:ferric-dicitrate binding protein FerR (iron transport regulator)